ENDRGFLRGPEFDIGFSGHILPPPKAKCSCEGFVRGKVTSACILQTNQQWQRVNQRSQIARLLAQLRRTVENAPFQKLERTPQLGQHAVEGRRQIADLVRCQNLYRLQLRGRATAGIACVTQSDAFYRGGQRDDGFGEAADPIHPDRNTQQQDQRGQYQNGSDGLMHVAQRILTREREAQHQAWLTLK